MYFVLALISVIVAALFWKGSTAPFLRENGRSVHFDSAFEPLGLVLDFLKAVFAGSGGDKTVPAGVYLHGLFLVLTTVFLVAAWSSDGTPV